MKRRLRGVPIHSEGPEVCSDLYSDKSSTGPPALPHTQLSKRVSPIFKKRISQATESPEVSRSNVSNNTATVSLSIQSYDQTVSTIASGTTKSHDALETEHIDKFIDSGVRGPPSEFKASCTKPSSSSNFGARRNVSHGTAHMEALDLTTIHSTAAVTIQSMFRGYNARCKVALLRVKSAREKGVMCAIGDTRQGESGWYFDDGLVYYIDMVAYERYDSSEAVLVGPILEGDFFKFRARALESPVMVACPGTVQGSSGYYLGNDGEVSQWMVTSTGVWIEADMPHETGVDFAATDLKRIDRELGIRRSNSSLSTGRQGGAETLLTLLDVSSEQSSDSSVVVVEKGVVRRDGSKKDNLGEEGRGRTRNSPTTGGHFPTTPQSSRFGGFRAKLVKKVSRENLHRGSSLSSMGSDGFGLRRGLSRSTSRTRSSKNRVGVGQKQNGDDDDGGRGGGGRLSSSFRRKGSSRRGGSEDGDLPLEDKKQSCSSPKGGGIIGDDDTTCIIC